MEGFIINLIIQDALYLNFYYYYSIIFQEFVNIIIRIGLLFV